MSARHFAILILIGSLFAPGVFAQQSVTAARPYDGIQAGLDAFRINEEQRQAAVGQQVMLNDTMRFWNGYPTSNIYYGYLNPAAMQSYGYGWPVMTRANLDYMYGYGVNPAWSGWRQGATGPLSVFSPWPYVPGDIWGYKAYYQAARQPVGQQQIQIGPNHWESHPVYDPPLTMYQPSPPVDSPLLDGTPYATPRPPAPVPHQPEASARGSAASSPAARDVIPPPPPAPRRVPREY